MENGNGMLQHSRIWKEKRLHEAMAYSSQQMEGAFNSVTRQRSMTFHVVVLGGNEDEVYIFQGNGSHTGPEVRGSLVFYKFQQLW